MSLLRPIIYLPYQDIELTFNVTVRSYNNYRLKNALCRFENMQDSYFGRSCEYAHSQRELDHWRGEHAKHGPSKQWVDDFKPYSDCDKLLAEYQNANNEISLVNTESIT